MAHASWFRATFFVAWCALAGPGIQAEAGQAAAEPPEAERNPFDDDEGEVRPLADPLRPMNRAFFVFNDRLYFWAVRPAADGYRFVIPRQARMGVRNFFTNLAGIRRGLNCLFQGRTGASGTEFARFGLNTTIGILGFTDPAKTWLKLRGNEADFGQTLGTWGMRPGWFLTWPLLGPSTGRDTLAWPLDAVLDPATFIPGAGLVKKINHVSLNPGEYEDLIKSALDPYVAVRDAYHQHREHLVRKHR